jgi:protocatechuate 3,4-dioxygenase beta subunit
VGLISTLSELCFGTRAIPEAHQPAPAKRRRTAARSGYRRCQIESLEPRRLMAGDVAPQVLLGSVYFEEATGDDSKPDIIRVSFEGGAAGTSLNRLVIDGDKLGDGLTTGDVFFDIAAGGLGAFGNVPLSILNHSGFTVDTISITDGGTKVEFTFSGFDAGEVFEFSVDVDEAQFVGGGSTDVNSVVEGGEFQRSIMTGHFTAPHYVDLTLSGSYWDAFDDEFAAGEAATGHNLNLPDDKYSPTHDFTDRTAGAVAYASQIPLATISGWVYHDRSDDGVFNSSEQGIGGVTLELLKNGVGTGITTTTSNSPGTVGYYEFIDLLPGSYGVREVQPAGWFDGKDTAGSHGGVAGNDIITGAVLNYGDDGLNYNFGELLPGSIAGRVILSQGVDCDFEDPQAFLEGIRIDLLDSSGNQIATTTTNALGEYSFTGLAPGSYQIREHQPTEYYDGGERVGSAGGSKHDVAGVYSFFTGIVLTSGLEAVNYDFCEHIGANLSGWVYHDRDNDGNFDRPGEQGIGGVTIELLVNGAATGITTVTSTAPGNVGFYEFRNLAPGTYTVRETQPVNWLDGKDKEGSHGGVAGNDIITGVPLNFGDDAIEYNFGELLPGSIRGRVHGDPGEDCNFDDPQNPLSGVKIDLLDAQGNVLATTFTDAEGYYQFTGLAPGEYGIREHQPEDYFDSGERVGTAGGQSHDVPGVFSFFTGIQLTSGFNAEDYDFCEKPPASISGRVHAHTGPNCDFDNPEFLLEGVKIDLLDMSGNVVATTFTDVNGEYIFMGLPKGIYQIREHQPTEYYDGGERVGTAGGSSFDIGDQYSMFTSIVLLPGMDAIQYDFCEHIGVMLSGYVYHDRSDDGIFDRTTEEGISGVVVKLLDEQGNDTGLRATTDATGFYKFNNLRAGKYAVMEIHPAGWLDGKDTEGNLGGIADASPGADMISMIMINWGEMGTEYNFGELKPGSIRGKVVVSTDPECDPDDGEPPIAGVQIDLLNDAGQVIATTHTDAEGRYEFTGLVPGFYSVREHQPVGYFDLDAHVGDGGGVRLSTNLIGDIEISSDEHAAHYDFCEEPPASLSGYVYIDGAPIFTGFTDDPLTPEQIYAQRDGVRTPDDTPLAGVLMLLVDGTSGEPISSDVALPGTYPPGSIVVLTDANGFYQFAGLRGGTYGVIQIQPEDVIDHVDHPGSLGGLALNADGIPIGRSFTSAGGIEIPTDPEFVFRMRQQFGDNVIYRIALPAGANSVENNFSEVQVAPVILQVPPERPEIPPPQVFAAPGFPFLPRLFVPPPNPVKLPEYFGGSAKALGYTWHLSVVNAGQPRSIKQATLFQYTSTIDASQWHDVPLDGGRWTLARFEGGNLSMLREEVFGHPRAIPVSGDFNGDGIWEVGVYIDGLWYVDLNGNGRWDEGDLWAKLGTESDRPVTGDWDSDGKTDIGIFGPAWPRDPWAIRHEPGLPDADNHPTRIAAKSKNLPPTADEATSGGRVMKRTAAGKPRTDLIDHVFNYGTPGDHPLAGDWNGDGIRAIGVFRDGQWSLDLDGDGRFTEADGSFTFGQAGDLPVVGDFNGDGVDEVGIYRDGKWIVDTNGNRQIDAHDVVFELGGADDAPVVGDWDGDGIDDPGTYRAGAAEDRLSRRAG